MKKPPRKPPSKRRGRVRGPHGPNRGLRVIANLHTQAARHQGEDAESVRRTILGYLREAWEDSNPDRFRTMEMDGQAMIEPAGAFAYALWMDDFDRRDEASWETVVAIVMREVERELVDPGYTNRPGYRDDLMF